MEVNVTKCVNDHFFDANKYSTCPHCGADAISSIATKATENAPGKTGWFNLFGLFHRGKKSVKPSSSDLSIEEYIIDDPNFDDFFDGIDDMTEGRIIEKTHDETEDKQHGGSLLEEVQNVTADNDGKTIGFFRSSMSPEDSSTKCETDPVCGWLVCIKGKHFGKCFNIYSGSNSIGRTSSNRIVISEEESISREKHAYIIYEPRKREFYIKPGEGSGLTYLNEVNVLESKRLSSGDKLEFSETTAFAFIAFCNENFSWDNYI